MVIYVVIIRKLFILLFLSIKMQFFADLIAYQIEWILTKNAAQLYES